MFLFTSYIFRARAQTALLCPCSVRILRMENNPFCNSGLFSMAETMARSAAPFAEPILNTSDLPGRFIDTRRRMAVVRDTAEGPETLAGQRLATEFDGKSQHAVDNVRFYGLCMALALALGALEALAMRGPVNHHPVIFSDSEVIHHLGDHSYRPGLVSDSP